MMIYSGCRVRLAMFCRAEIRAGCCPGFRARGRVEFYPLPSLFTFPSVAFRLLL